MRSKSLTASLMLGALLALPFHGEARQSEGQLQLPQQTKETNRQYAVPQGTSHFRNGHAIEQYQRYPAPVAETAKRAERPIPFHGTVASVNRSGQSFTLESKSGTGRTLNITGRTALSEQGNPAGFNALSKGEMVRGSYWKLPNGSLEAKTVKVGPLTPAEQAAKEQAKAARSAKKAALH